MSWRGGRVHCRKDGFDEVLGRPWSVWVVDQHGDPVAQMHFATGAEAMAWAVILADPAGTFAAIWDGGVNAGQRTGFGLGIYGPLTNPFRTPRKRRKP